MKLWDTETGQCLKRFNNGKIPYVVKFHPDEDKQHIFLAGMSDKKIIQVRLSQGSLDPLLIFTNGKYDINSGEITQEYDQHLGPVNTITFVDENRRFVTTSDDKTIRAWDFDIPVVIKYIAEPHMHSMPSVTLHPSSTSFFLNSSSPILISYSQRNILLLNHLIIKFSYTVPITSVRTARNDLLVILSLDTHAKSDFPLTVNG